GGLQSSLASAERAFELLDAEPDVPDRPDARPLRRAEGRLEFRDVSFSYDGEHQVLHGISFEIEPGTKLGIAGRTGAGKTTLVNLASRFYDPMAGNILLDDVDLRDYRLADLRNQFGIVLQEPVLFSTTVAENIAYARPDASFEEIAAAAKAANAHDFIAALPEGYDTEVGERGMRLSGGERQRISLARAFLKDAPILILDEPTSSVDLRTEALIIEAMERLMTGRIVLMIAHRLSTLENCDARMVLEEGRIVSATGAIRAAADPPDPATPALATAGGSETLEEGATTPAAGEDTARLPSFSAGAHPPDKLDLVPPAVLEHPAFQAWLRLDAGGGVPTLIEPLPDGANGYPKAFRLHGLDLSDTPVIAQRSREEGLRVERLVHEEVLPCLGIPSAHLLGVTADDDGERWLFVEEPVGQPFDPRSAVHRAVAMDWFALLHTRSAQLDLRGLLPDRSPRHYLDQLRLTRQRLRSGFNTPDLPQMNRVVLRAVSDRCDMLEWHWERFERCTDGLPLALVHGRVGANNAYVRPEDPRFPLLVLDWEMAGWGPPAADLQPQSVGLYSERIRESWTEVSRKQLTAAALAGAIFRELEAMELRTRAPDWLRAEGTVQKLAGHDRQLRRACLLMGLPLVQGREKGAR
ncbi:MAG: ATP-binding cassette domain-containing protein, partial [Actinomycetota bacterium]|nr:ATP-binding cassette domain-containing protein [Actinomycetota bacterium]